MQSCHDDHFHIIFILTITHIMLMNEKYTDITTFSVVYFWLVRDRQKKLPVFRIKHDILTVRTLYRQIWRVRTAIYFVIFWKPAISFAGLPQKKQDILPVFPVMKSARKTGKKPEKCVLRPERPDHLVCFPGFGNEVHSNQHLLVMERFLWQVSVTKNVAQVYGYLHMLRGWWLVV